MREENINKKFYMCVRVFSFCKELLGNNFILNNNNNMQVVCVLGLTYTL